jgi:hypothetical protein
MTSRTEIKFQPNVPVEVLLDRADGKEYPSKFENAESRWYYTVNGNTAFMYLPTTARNQLVRTRAAAGDTVKICKTVDGKSTQWYVEVLSDATEPVETKVSTPAPGPRIVAVSGPPVDARQAAQKPAPARTATTNGANALQPKPVAPLSSHPMVERYTRMFLAAAQSLKATHQQLVADPFYAELEPPTWDDIRSLCVHWAISLEKKEAHQQ